MISSNSSVIRDLTKLLLEKYTGKKVNDAFRIINAHGADVKEITAKGVLEGLGLAAGFQIPAGILSQVVDYGFDGFDKLTYADVRTDKVRETALGSFNKFIDSLQSPDFTNFVFNKFGLTIPDRLIRDLRAFARNSFVTMSANIPAQYNDLNVAETLFFWPLKNSLVELSKRYQTYK